MAVTVMNATKKLQNSSTLQLACLEVETFVKSALQTLARGNLFIRHYCIEFIHTMHERLLH